MRGDYIARPNWVAGTPKHDADRTVVIATTYPGEALVSEGELWLEAKRRVAL